MLNEGSANRIQIYSKEESYGELTWFSKATSDAGLRCEEISILPVTKTFLDLGNDLDFLSHPLGKIVKPQVAFARLEGIEPRKLLRSRKVHLLLNEEDEESYHVSPPIGKHLKYGQIVVVEDIP